MAPAVKACKEAVEKRGLPHEDVLNYIALAFRLEEFGRAIERGGSGKRR
jgi:hypothetical protein